MQNRYLERPDGRLAYSDYGGDGPPVLMLPGIGDLRAEYRFLAPQLRDSGYRAVVVDLRGHGESSVPWLPYDVPSVGGDILAMIEHLKAGPAHVIGTSFAGGAAVWAAVERPEAVRSLVLIGAFVREARINPLMKGLFWLLMHNPWRVRTWTWYYRSLYPSRKPDDFDSYIAQLAANMAQPGRLDAASALAFSPRRPSEERLSLVKVPTLVIMGTNDTDFPDPVAEGKLIAEQTGGRLEMIEGAGHYPHAEMPDQTLPKVLSMLEQSAR